MCLFFRRGCKKKAARESDSNVQTNEFPEAPNGQERISNSASENNSNFDPYECSESRNDKSTQDSTEFHKHHDNSSQDSNESHEERYDETPQGPDGSNENCNGNNTQDFNEFHVNPNAKSLFAKYCGYYLFFIIILLVISLLVNFGAKYVLAIKEKRHEQEKLRLKSEIKKLKLQMKKLKVILKRKHKSKHRSKRKHQKTGFGSSQEKDYLMNNVDYELGGRRIVNFDYLWDVLKKICQTTRQNHAR